MWHLLLHAASLTLLLQGPLFVLVAAVGTLSIFRGRKTPWSDPGEDAILSRVKWLGSRTLKCAVIAAGLWLIAMPVLFVIDEGEFKTYEPVFVALGPIVYALVGTLVLWALVLLLTLIQLPTRVSVQNLSGYQARAMYESHVADIVAGPGVVTILLALAAVMVGVLAIVYGGWSRLVNSL
jgi:hypothetical protein